MPPDGRITSRSHPLIARLRAAARRDGDDVLLDGPHLLAEALNSPWFEAGGRCTLRLVVVTQDAVERTEIGQLCDRAAARGLPVHLVPPSFATAISPARSPTGLVALADVALATLEETIRPAPAATVVLAGVQDPGNVGTIIRTAEAAGATGVVLLPGTADPLGWKALRASMGSALRIALHRATDRDTPLDRLRAAGLQIVAADNRPRAAAAAVDVRQPLALVIGAEGGGLPDGLLSDTDATVRIALASPVESLNAASAAAVLLFEVRRLRDGRDSALGV